MISRPTADHHFDLASALAKIGTEPRRLKRVHNSGAARASGPMALHDSDLEG
jgi:hypothetical protein